MKTKTTTYIKKNLNKLIDKNKAKIGDTVKLPKFETKPLDEETYKVLDNMINEKGD